MEKYIAFFERAFTTQEYSRFVAELFTTYDRSKAWTQPRTGAYIPEKFRDHVASIDRIGRYTDAHNNTIDILIVTLKEQKNISSTRTAQRNYIAEYLKGNHGSSTRKHAALVAFVSHNKQDWRLSLVTLNITASEDTEKIKLKDTYSAANRKSFLLGANEKNHTAKKRFTEAIAQAYPPPLHTHSLSRKFGRHI